MNLIDRLGNWERKLEELEREIADTDDEEGRARRLRLGDAAAALRRDIREVRLWFLRRET